MKLIDLEFLAFGCFSNVRLHFGADGKKFHVIYGNNEAGKSTALRGLTNFFYGIPARTSDVFRHEAKTLRIAAEIEKSDGQRLTCVRRKGNQNTLLTRAEEPLLESALQAFLGGLSEEAFTTIYRLDHETLVRGGEELREGKGDLAEALFQAGAGITGLRQTLKGLEEEANEIFKAGRAQNPPINRAIDAYKGAQKRSKELSVKPADWTKKRDEMTETEEALEAEQAALTRLQADAKRLDRLKLAWPHAAQLRVVDAALAELGEFVRLPESSAHERIDAERREREATARREQSEGKIGRTEAEIARLDAPEELIGQALAIGGVHQRLGRHQQAVTDLPIVRAEVKRDQEEAERILRALRPDAAGAAGASFEISALARERIEDLANRYPALECSVAEGARRRKEAAEELAQAEALLGPEAPLTDPSALRQILARMQKDGDLEAAMRDARARLQSLEAQAEREIARLVRWEGSGAELEKAAFPSVETVERFENEWAEAEQARRESLQQAEQAKEKLRQAETRIQTLQLGGEVPTERELELKRERREKGWALIRRAWLDGKPDRAGEKDFHSEKPLAEAYEEAVEEADATADRLRREAERVGQLAMLLAARDESRDRLAESERACEAAHAARETLQKSWDAAWRPTGVAPASPREMRAWLTQCAGALRALDEARRQRGALEQLTALAGERAAEIREALTALGEKATANASLPALIDCAAALLTRIEETRARREKLQSEIKQRAQAARKAAREAEEAAAELRTWREEWRQAVAPLALGQEPDARGALAALRQIDQFLQKQGAAQQGSVRVESMAAAIAQFEKEVASLVEAVAADLRGLPPDQAAVQLQSRLSAAQKNAAQRQTLERQLVQEREQLERSDAEIRSAKADMERLLQAAGCNTREELIAAEEKAAKARNLDRERDELLRALARLSGGAPVETFLTELDALPADRLAADYETTQAGIAQREAAIGQLQTALGRFQTELSVMDGGEQAAQAQEEAQQAAAEIESLTARYLRLRIASGILRRQIDLYRKENQGPVIRRASELFPRLTRNSFASLKTGFDDKDRPVLLGVRDSEEEVLVTGMSEGTRDQLYLAFRLASLERQMEGCEPAPFILDDILISFDNDRARDTLRVLAELCSKTQVLFFTHHAHLLELAREAVPEEILAIHELGRCGAAGEDANCEAQIQSGDKREA